MELLKTLIQLTHPVLICEAIDAYIGGAEIDDAALQAVTMLYTDDTFSEYSDAELQMAVSELITEY